MSSQYLTALLMAAPLATGAEGIEIKISDELVSQPYVDMTVKLMERFGVTVCGRGRAFCRHFLTPSFCGLLSCWARERVERGRA